ncbi:MAG: sensor histidine kinase, partial [Gaiellaceae bacterium]
LQIRLIAAARVASLHGQLAEQRTELEGLNHRLADTNEELRNLDRLKDEFVALVSHELRTPLTSIAGYVNALQRGRAGVVPPQQRELLSIVDRNAQRLTRVVSDLLLGATADAGKLQLEREPLEVGAVVRQAVESARPRAAEQRVRLELFLSEPAHVFADHARLLQVFDNLFSNAIKFSPAGGTVDVHVSSAGSSAAIEVRDEGIGIPHAEQEHLFRRFFRASTATSREIPGSGLGLNIAKTIVDLHEGTIEVRSREDIGTTFVVTLPLALAQEAAA